MGKRNKRPLIGVDIMGSDAAPEHLFEAIVQLKKTDFPADFVVFAGPKFKNRLPSICSFVFCDEFVEMKENPLSAVLRKKASSLYLGIQSVKEKKIDAFVSAGSTGALLFASKTILKTLPGITRPALLTVLPSKKGDVAVLDVGANLTLRSEHILQFAAMGVAFQKSRGITSPKVGLLNVGTESIKGTPQVRQAYKKLLTLNQKETLFIGNIEGKDIFQSSIDVVLTDGFTGNVFLKTAEGTASFILEEMTLRAPHFSKELEEIKKKLYVTEHPGAILCGVDGMIVKCHGSATASTFLSSIKGACQLVQNQFLKKIVHHLKESFS